MGKQQIHYPKLMFSVESGLLCGMGTGPLNLHTYGLLKDTVAKGKNHMHVVSLLMAQHVKFTCELYCFTCAGPTNATRCVSHMYNQRCSKICTIKFIFIILYTYSFLLYRICTNFQGMQFSRFLRSTGYPRNFHPCGKKFWLASIGEQDT